MHLAPELFRNPALFETPHWVLICTFRDDLCLVGIVDNEIDAVRAAQRHIARFSETHRPLMHLCALTTQLGDLYRGYYLAPLPKRLEQRQQVLDYLNKTPNLYRPEMTGVQA